MKSAFVQSLAATALAAFTTTAMAQAQSRYDELADMPFVQGYVANDNGQKLLDELFFQRGVQSLPLGGTRPQHVWHEGRLREGLRQRLQRAAGLEAAAQCQDADYHAELGRHLCNGLSRSERGWPYRHRTATEDAGDSR